MEKFDTWSTADCKVAESTDRVFIVVERFVSEFSQVVEFVFISDEIKVCAEVETLARQKF